MWSQLKFIFPLLVFLIILLFFKIGLGKDPQLLPSLLVDKPMPRFTAVGLYSNPISNKQFLGKVTLLNVWATWCKSCKIEQPVLLDMNNFNDFQLLGLDYKDDKVEALQYLNKNGNPYKEVIYDAQGELALELGVYGVPESFIIDKKGIVRYRYVGPITIEAFEKDLLPRIKAIVAEG